MLSTIAKTLSSAFVGVIETMPAAAFKSASIIPTIKAAFLATQARMFATMFICPPLLFEKNVRLYDSILKDGLTIEGS
jgi:hypothetical protein